METVSMTPYIIWFITWPVLLYVSWLAVKYSIKKWEEKND